MFEAELLRSNASLNQAPLSPINMLLAGVAPADVIWFRRLKGGDKFKALEGERGLAILAKVREHEMRKAGTGAMPMPA